MIQLDIKVYFFYISIKMEGDMTGMPESLRWLAVETVVHDDDDDAFIVHDDVVEDVTDDDDDVEEEEEEVEEVHIPVYKIFANTLKFNSNGELDLTDAVTRDIVFNAIKYNEDVPLDYPIDDINEIIQVFYINDDNEVVIRRFANEDECYTFFGIYNDDYITIVSEMNNKIRPMVLSVYIDDDDDMP